LLNVDPRTPTAAGEKRAEGGRVDEGAGAGQAGEKGWAAFRLCNLVAPSEGDAKRRVPAGGREGTKRAGNGAVGDCLFQTVREPDSSRGEGNRDGCSDARNRQVSRLLSGNDLC